LVSDVRGECSNRLKEPRSRACGEHLGWLVFGARSILDSQSDVNKLSDGMSFIVCHPSLALPIEGREPED
jgi:hypothetical protein